MKALVTKKRILSAVIGSMISFSAYSISAEEITSTIAARREAKLAEFDINGDGEFSRKERRAMQDARYEAMLVDFDTDGDGELSRAERRSAREAHRAAMEQQLDVNQDGVVSDEERAGLESVKSERGFGKRKGKKHGKPGRKGSEQDTALAE